jgi:hypothetical protein
MNDIVTKDDLLDIINTPQPERSTTMNTVSESRQVNRLSEGGGAKVAVDKPTSLSDAVNEMDSVSNRLATLLARVAGHDQESPKAEPPHHMTLAALLSDGPSFIREKVSIQQQRLDEIESILFG